MFKYEENPAVGMRQKRGLSALETVMGVVLLLILAAIFLTPIIRSSKLFGTQYNKWELQGKAESCKAQASFSTVFLDIDFGKTGDGSPDGCDLCLGSDDSRDCDLDGIPDACDNDPTLPPPSGKTMEWICEEAGANKEGKSGSSSEQGQTWSKRGQCVLAKCYNTQHGCEKPSGSCPVPGIT
jgi:hypothetical protein